MPAGYLDLETAAASCASSVDVEPAHAPGPCAAKRAAVLGGLALASALAALLPLRAHPAERSRTDVGAVVGLSSASAGTQLPPPVSSALDEYFQQMMGVPSAPVDLYDGNKCLDEEEEFEGLCYRKCALLTNGTFELRTSAWTCCHAASIDNCFVRNQHKDFGFCSGFDVAGDGKSCPHAPGKCLDNEELFLGECFEKCSILTNGKRPHRTSAISCCETPLALRCFMPGKVSVSKDLNTGGGKGDGDERTPAEAHDPLTSLTEGGGAATKASV